MASLNFRIDGQQAISTLREIRSSMEETAQAFEGLKDSCARFLSQLEHLDAFDNKIRTIASSCSLLWLRLQSVVRGFSNFGGVTRVLDEVANRASHAAYSVRDRATPSINTNFKLSEDAGSSFDPLVVGMGRASEAASILWLRLHSVTRALESLERAGENLKSVYGTLNLLGSHFQSLLANVRETTGAVNQLAKRFPKAPSSHIANKVNESKLPAASGTPAGAEADQIAKVDTHLDRINKKAKETASNFGTVRNAIKNAFTVYILYEFSSAVSNTVLGITRMENALITATGSTQAAKDAFSSIKESSMKLGTDLLSSAKGFALLTAAAKDAGLSTKETETIFKAIQTTSTALSYSEADTMAVFQTFVQMLSKGKLQAEEIRGQLGERLPGAFQKLAKSMGVTSAELSEMLKKGEVYSDVLVGFSETLIKDFEEGAKKASNELPAILARLKNTMVTTLKDISEAGGFDPIKSIFANFASLVESSDFKTSFTSVINSILQFVDQISEALFAGSGGLIQFFNMLESGLKEFGPLIKETLSIALSTIEELLKLFNSFPDWIAGAAGVGLVGGILLGPVPAAVLAALAVAIDRAKKLAEATKNLSGGVSAAGIPDFSTIWELDNGGQDVYEKYPKKIDPVLEKSKELKDEVKGLTDEFINLKQSGIKDDSVWNNFIQKLMNTQTEITRLKEEHPELQTEFNETTRAISAAERALSSLLNTFKGFSAANLLEPIERIRLGVLKKTEDAAKAWDTKFGEDVGNILDRTQKRSEKLYEELEKLRAAKKALDESSMDSVAKRARAAQLEEAQTRLNKEWWEAYLSETKPKGGGGKEPPIVDYPDIDRQITSIEKRIQDSEQKICDIRAESFIQQAEMGGRFAEAEAVRIEQWKQNQIMNMLETINAAKASAADLQQKIAEAESKGGHATPAAVMRLQLLENKMNELREKLPEFVKEVEKLGDIQEYWKKYETGLADQQKLLDASKGYYQLAGSMEAVYLMEVKLLELQKHKELLHIDPETNKELYQALERLYDEQIRLKKLQATGSVFDGIREGLVMIRTDLPTAFDIGKQTMDQFKSAVSDLADTFTEFLMTGKADWWDFVNSVIRGLLKLQIEMLLMKVFFGEGGNGKSFFGTMFSWLIPSGHTGGALSETGGTFRAVSGMQIPSFHNGLGADEFLALLKRDEIVLSPESVKELTRVKPVKTNVSGGSNGNIQTTINVAVTAPSGALAGTPGQYDAMAARKLSQDIAKAIETKMNEVLGKHQRAGGFLSRGGISGT